MGIFDKAKDLAAEHDDKVDEGIEKAGDFLNEKTGGAHKEMIDRARDFAQEHTGEGDTVNGGGENR